MDSQPRPPGDCERSSKEFATRMNDNRILVDGWSNPVTKALYESQWATAPKIREQYEEGVQCGGCSFFAPFDSDWGYVATRNHCTISKQFLNTSHVRRLARNVGGPIVSQKIPNSIADAMARIHSGGRKCVQSSQMSGVEMAPVTYPTLDGKRRTRKFTRVADRAFSEVKVTSRQPGDFWRSTFTGKRKCDF